MSGYRDPRLCNAPERCDEEGAAVLQRKIRAHWAPYVIEFKTVQAPFHYAVRKARTDLRSDMINGLPRGLYLERMKQQGRGR